MEQKTMKALVYQEPHKYDLMDVPVPQIVEPTDVIARVTLAAICSSDIHTVHGEITGSPYPKTMGHEFCGEIVEVGSAITGFKVGDRFVSRPGVDCGECIMCKLNLRAMCQNGGIYGGHGPLEGCHAEYMRIPFAERDGMIFKIPDSLTFEDVVLVPDMLGTAYFAVTNAEVKEGQTIAVIGCGPVGLSCCLVAKKMFGAKKVIAVDLLKYRVDAAIAAGVADVGIDASTEDVVQRIKELSGIGVDATIETAGTQETIAQSVSATRPVGVVSTVSIFSNPQLSIPIKEMTVKNLKFKLGIHDCVGVPDMLKLIEEGKLDTRFMLTHKAPLNDIMKGYEVFGNRQDNCIKWLITPYER